MRELGGDIIETYDGEGLPATYFRPTGSRELVDLTLHKLAAKRDRALAALVAACRRVDALAHWYRMHGVPFMG